jgi:hypothetical protein
MEHDRKGAANYGIQASQVTATVLAVGTGAVASQRLELGAGDVHRLVAELRQALDAAVADPAQRAILERDVEQIERAALSETPSKQEVSGLLNGLVTKLKLVGVVLSTATSLAKPLIALARFVGVPLPLG